MMDLDDALKYAQNALERAFEDWLESERPSGDCESVHRQWGESFAHMELVDELQPVMALTWEVRRLREENERLRKDADVGSAIQRAAAESPRRYIVGISVEADAATVELCLPSGHIKTMDADDENRLAAEINAAIDTAKRHCAILPYSCK